MALLCILCLSLLVMIAFASEEVIHRRRLEDTATTVILNRTDVTFSSSLTLFYDPPNGHFEPTALGIFTRVYFDNEDTSLSQTAIVYNDGALDEPITFNSSSTTYAAPYIMLTTPFQGVRTKTLKMIAVLEYEPGKYYRTNVITVNYIVEGGARPNSYGFFVPGIESGGYFIRAALEIAAAARAQAAGSQEFANFTSNLGIGTYDTQINALDLIGLDGNLTGFEGGYAMNCSGKHYGILVPYHNGEDFFGKVVRVNLREMDNVTTCASSYRVETMVNGQVMVSGNPKFPERPIPEEHEACVTVLDLQSLHPFAKGFRRGFIGDPYLYLSAGEFSVVGRVNFRNFTLNTTRLVDLSTANREFGGYSGGFLDGTWACFNPYRSFAGPIGGIRSNLRVDANHLRPYFISTLVCLNSTAWDFSGVPSIVAANIQILDFSKMEEDLRGFADCIRMGRYAYFVPLTSAEHTYSYKVVRVSLGKDDFGTTLQNMYALNVNATGRDVLDILDLSKISTNLAGYSGVFSSGKYLFFVPYRNAYEPSNGQRGHGFITRLDMNKFGLTGIDYLDLTTASRNQIPSFADVNLRGYSFGFASGSYGLLVPFFNAIFSGKVARFYSQLSTMASDVQELDMTVDTYHPNTFRGYRGGFTSLWQGSDF